MKRWFVATLSLLAGPTLFAVGLFSLAQAQAPTVRSVILDKRPAPNVGGACSEATMFLARTSGLDGTHTTAYTNLICGLVTDGIYTAFDGLYGLATQDSTTSLLNVAQNAFNLSVSGSPIFTPDSGYVASSGQLLTGFNPSTAVSPQYTQNSAHLSLWNLTNNTDVNAAMGNSAAGTSGESHVFVKFSDNNFYARINSAGAGGTAISDPRGHLIGNRSSIIAIQVYQNGSSFGSVVDTSAAPSNQAFQILGVSGATPDNVHHIAAASFGRSLNSTEAGNYYARLRTYMTAVGVP